MLTGKRRDHDQNAEEQAQAYIDQLMTVDELMDEFTMRNEEQLRQFALPAQPSVTKRSSGNTANQGVAQVIDKTFSKIEVKKELSKN